MKFFVGVTDNQWFDYLRQLKSRSPEYLDEVNFWQPSAQIPFKSIQPGEIFLFKLHSPKDFIVGGGIFARPSVVPISLAWEAFGPKNGAGSYEEMRRQIIRHRRIHYNLAEDFKIGCIILTQPFFFDESEWFPVPEWSRPIVRGKIYGLDSDAGRIIWKNIAQIWKKRKVFDLDKEARKLEAEHARYGKEITIRPRLGQGAFKIAVTDAYNRSCAITEEHALPALEASHIKPFKENGPNEIFNGLLLRSDVHRLFDRGYITVTPDLRIEVSPRIREEFENGRYYYPFHGHRLHHLPSNPADHPSQELLIWHNDNIFRG